MQKLIYIPSQVYYDILYPHHTHEIRSQKKKKKKKKKKGNHEPTSQIKTSLIVNEDISKQR